MIERLISFHRFLLDFIILLYNIVAHIYIYRIIQYTCYAWAGIHCFSKIEKKMLPNIFAFDVKIRKHLMSRGVYIHLLDMYCSCILCQTCRVVHLKIILSYSCKMDLWLQKKHNYTLLLIEFICGIKIILNSLLFMTMNALDQGFFQK